jgi:serine/threonine protein kinase
MYPSLSEYNAALQFPQIAFSDSELQGGTILSNRYGTPLSIQGGFAMAYQVTSATGKKYAARCFFKESKKLEERYKAIFDRLSLLNSSFFLVPEFQPQGVRVRTAGKTQMFPLVKMEWASGETLNTFLRNNYKNKAALRNLDDSLLNLTSFLETNKIAHGDINLGNIMVADFGRTIQLIDYDGMYVEALQAFGNSEFGIPHFQHPQRGKKWNAQLDRFSFIVLYLALKALEASPKLWDETQSGDKWVVLKDSDFSSPDTSPVLQKLQGLPQFAKYVQLFKKICQSPFGDIPTLEEFIAGVTKTATPPQPLIPYPHSPISTTPGIAPPPPNVTPLELIQQALQIIGKNIAGHLQRPKKHIREHIRTYIIFGIVLLASLYFLSKPPPNGPNVKPEVAAHFVRLESGRVELALRVLAPGRTIEAVRIDNLGGKSSLWRSDSKDGAQPISVSLGGVPHSSGAQTMNLRMGKEKEQLSLSLRDNGAFAGKKTDFRAIVFFADGEQAQVQVELPTGMGKP